jgi:uncharacterized membrane protein
MSDETQTPGAGPGGTGQETNLGGSASEWSTVPSPSQPPPPPAPPSPPAQALEPLPPAPSQPATSGGYQPVYGTGPATQSGGGYPPPPPPQQAAPPPGYGGGPGPQYPPPPPPAAGQGLSSNAAAAISYITFIPAVIFLVVEPYNRDRFVRFHSWQSIALCVVGVVISILFGMFRFMGFHMLLWTFHSLIDLVLFVFWLMALIKASQGQWYKIPIVGDIAASFGGAQP